MRPTIIDVATHVHRAIPRGFRGLAWLLRSTRELNYSLYLVYLQQQPLIIFTANLSTTTHSTALQVEWLLYVNCDVPHNQAYVQCCMHNSSLCCLQEILHVSVSQKLPPDATRCNLTKVEYKKFQSCGSICPQTSLGG